MEFVYGVIVGMVVMFGTMRGFLYFALIGTMVKEITKFREAMEKYYETTNEP